MKTAMALRHIHFEDVGTLNDVLAERGYALHYRDPACDELDDDAVRHADMLIVLGGPIGAYDEAAYPFIERELSIVRQRLESGRPLLGICLGAQLIARAAGAKVYPLRVKEIGFAPLTLTPAGKVSVLAGLEHASVLHWHGDQFDIPEGATHLASTPVGAHQAFALGHCVLGLQFHLELDPDRFERWLVGHAAELGQAQIDPRNLRAQATEAGHRLVAAARSVFAAWIDGLEATVS
jgi:GMP synthase (glutamine-hydrolysing)